MKTNNDKRKKYIIAEEESILIPKIDPVESEENENYSDYSFNEDVNFFSKFLKKINIKKFFTLKRTDSIQNNLDISKNHSKKKYKKIIFFALILFLILVLIQGIFGYLIYEKGLELRNSAFELAESTKSKDFKVVKSQIANTRLKLSEFDKAYRRTEWVSYIPFVGKYVLDGRNIINSGFYGLETLDILVETAEPYSDLIGYGNKDAIDKKEETTQDRVDFIVKTLPDLVPKVDLISNKFSLLKNEIDQINPDDYPKSFFGIALKDKIRLLVESFDMVADLVKNAKPLLEVSPQLLGVEKEQKYLVLFQNDKELRPTGGFITAYAIASVVNGKFNPTLSDDIYNLDNNYKPSVAAPQPIIDYIKGPYLLSKYLRLRDMNWSPDFSVSMDLFTQEVEKAGIKGISGIIAVDTQVLVNLLDVIGPINVPGYGEFSNKIVPECNCPQVIYELESFADIEGPIVWSENEPGKIVYAPANYDNRKKIIGPLMNSILTAALGQPKEKVPALFEAGFKSLYEKHVLLYLVDKKSQEAVARIGIGGTIREYDGDYLHINDANLGGRKSNLYVTQDVEQNVEIDPEGNVLKSLTITYKNPEKHDGWLNSVLPNWVRVYVPKGSELISSEGLQKKGETYDEFGKSVFSGYFELRPQGIAKINFKYKLPFRVRDKYSILIQKQPGKDKSLYVINLGKEENEFYLKNDREINFKI